MNNKITFNSKYKGLLINTCKAKNYGAYSAILKTIHSQLTALLSHHSRISVLVFTLHVKFVCDSASKTWNQVVSEFFKQVKIRLKKDRWGSHKNIVHNWVREIGNDEKEHYHCYIAFKHSYRRVGLISSDGYTGLWKELSDAWSAVSGGYMRPDNAHTINRGDEAQLSDAFYHLSYAAKVRDKDFCTGDQHKRYSGSRLSLKASTEKNHNVSLDHKLVARSLGYIAFGQATTLKEPANQVLRVMPITAASPMADC